MIIFIVLKSSSYPLREEYVGILEYNVMYYYRCDLWLIGLLTDTQLSEKVIYLSLDNL